ncbi:hypothetical protein HXX76_006769 [Chlamydomonas incerta]|uniref:Uncharacterized protein n=1 Tax=Chlamydomonas incerta TaxID=51695 RepID=A0A835W5H7_CHLIN|nr:hypothetical protein HXX76_006769 [Chlamydomonas incerta]|eukprot:KAG2436466.1 hypothetical protein HXX76_006769 [Chlamydomonas incerta]
MVRLPSRRMLRSSGSMSLRSSWRVRLLDAAAPGAGAAGEQDRDRDTGSTDDGAVGAISGRFGGHSVTNRSGVRADNCSGNGTDMGFAAQSPSSPPCQPQPPSPGSAAAASDGVLPAVDPSPAAAAPWPQGPRSPGAAGGGGAGLSPSPRPPQELVRTARSASSAAASAAGANSGAGTTVSGSGRSFTGAGSGGAGCSPALMLRSIEEAASRQAAFRRDGGIGGGGDSLRRCAPAPPSPGARPSPQTFLTSSLGCEVPEDGGGDADVYLVTTAPASPEKRMLSVTPAGVSPGPAAPVGAGSSGSGEGQRRRATLLERAPSRMGVVSAAAASGEEAVGSCAPLDGGGGGGNDSCAVGTMGSLSFRFPRTPQLAVRATSRRHADTPAIPSPEALQPHAATTDPADSGSPTASSLRAALSGRSFASASPITRAVVVDGGSGAPHGGGPSPPGVLRSSRSFTAPNVMSRGRSFRELSAASGLAAGGGGSSHHAAAAAAQGPGARSSPSSPLTSYPCCPRSRSPGGGNAAAAPGYDAEAASTGAPLRAGTQQVDMALRPTPAAQAYAVPHCMAGGLSASASQHGLLGRLRGLFT